MGDEKIYNRSYALASELSILLRESDSLCLRSEIAEEISLCITEAFKLFPQGLRSGNTSGSKLENIMTILTEQLNTVKKMKIYAVSTSRLRQFSVSFFGSLTELHLDMCPPSIVDGLYSKRNQINILNIYNSGITDMSKVLSPIDQKLLRKLIPLRLMESKFTIPSEFLWDKLITLRLSNCGIVKLDESMHFFPSLKYLDLSNNSISHIIHLQDCLNLQFMDVSHNRIRVLSNLNMVVINLIRLNLSYNEIESLDGIDQLLSLERIDLSNNKINDYNDIQHIAKLPLLAWVKLSDNPVADHPEYRVKVFREMIKAQTKYGLNRALPTLDGYKIRSKERKFLRGEMFRVAEASTEKKSNSTSKSERSLQSLSLDDWNNQDDDDEMSRIDAQSGSFSVVNFSSFNNTIINYNADSNMSSTANGRSAPESFSPKPITSVTSGVVAGKNTIDSFYNVSIDSNGSLRRPNTSNSPRNGSNRSYRYKINRTRRQKNVSVINSSNYVEKTIDLDDIERDLSERRKEKLVLLELRKERYLQQLLHNNAIAEAAAIAAENEINLKIENAVENHHNSSDVKEDYNNYDITSNNIDLNRNANVVNATNNDISRDNLDYVDNNNDNNDNNDTDSDGNEDKVGWKDLDDLQQDNNEDREEDVAIDFNSDNNNDDYDDDNSAEDNKYLASSPIPITNFRSNVYMYIGDKEYEMLGIAENFELYCREQIFGENNRSSGLSAYLQMPTEPAIEVFGLNWDRNMKRVDASGFGIYNDGINRVPPDAVTFTPAPPVEEKFVALFYENIIDVSSEISNNTDINNHQIRSSNDKSKEKEPEEIPVVIILTNWNLYVVYKQSISPLNLFCEAPIPVVMKTFPLYSLIRCTIYFGFQRCALGFVDPNYCKCDGDHLTLIDESCSTIITDELMIVTRDKTRTYPITLRVPQTANLLRNKIQPNPLRNVLIENQDSQLLSSLFKSNNNKSNSILTVDQDIIYYQMIFQTWRKRPGIKLPRTLIITQSAILLCLEELSSVEIELNVLDSAPLHDIHQIVVEDNPSFVTIVFKASRVFSTKRKWRLVGESKTVMLRLYEECRRISIEAGNSNI
eukprot:gene4255-6034_t